MAKKRRSRIKRRDVKEGKIFVDSKRYGGHERAAKFTYTPVSINDTFRTNADRTKLFTQLAKTIHGPLREERIDGGLWSRIMKLFFNSAKDTGKVAPECLLGLECNEDHKTDGVLKDGYVISVSPKRKKLHVSLQLHKHPIVEGKIPRDGYLIRFIAIFPDFDSFTSKKEVVDSPLLSYSSEPGPMEFAITMPYTKSPYVLLMTMRSSYNGDTNVTTAREYFLKVVAMG